MQLVNVPFSLATLWRAGAGGWKSIELGVADFASDPTELWLEQVIFASLFGFMCKDFILHYNRPDPLLAVHHISVCFLCVAMAFSDGLAGVRLYAFITVFVEVCCTG